MRKETKEKLPIEQVEHIAQLARIELKEQEKEKFSKQLTSILGYVEKLNEVDTSDVEPTSHVVGLVSVMRPDKVESYRECKKLIEAAPEDKDRCVKVKAVLEGGK
jgi:aspartyl-tRNA(Asn)/glutamyl-tRNA(Gln) amidotransferase subunit C